MMYWDTDRVSGWGFALMNLSMLLFWILLIVAGVVLVRYLGGHDHPVADRTPSGATPEQILAERFARGEIDEAEYRRRLDTLQGRAPRSVDGTRAG
jgi:putative membrane protein